MARRKKKSRIANESQYKLAKKVEYRGILFDSILELKFALMIESKCAWMREPKTIFYDPATCESVTYVQKHHKRYTPDFMVRKWHNNKAFVVEVKPLEFSVTMEMVDRRLAFMKYIQKRGLDWKFIVMTEKDIKLNMIQKEKLKLILAGNSELEKKLEIIKADRKYNNYRRKHFHNIPTLEEGELDYKEYKRYVLHGLLPVNG